MTNLQPFEIDVLRRLTKDVLPVGALDTAIANGDAESYKYTGYGYFVGFRHASLPAGRAVCSEPKIIGIGDGREAGFVVFIEDGGLTLECYPVNGEAIPESFRACQVALRIA